LHRFERRDLRAPDTGRIAQQFAEHLTMINEAAQRDTKKTEAMIELFSRVRAQTMRIVAPLEIEDYVVQTAEFMSPPRWHIGHTSWFFETLLQTCLPGYRIYNEEYLYYFNSYYEG